MSIQERIRAEAAAKIRVRITGRSRSSTGFDVTFSKLADNTGTGSGGIRKNVPSKQQALTHLLTVLRCMNPIEITVAPAKKFKLGKGGVCNRFESERFTEDGVEPVCVNCGSYKNEHTK
jgi:hypothetical protein